MRVRAYPKARISRQEAQSINLPEKLLCVIRCVSRFPVPADSCMRSQATVGPATTPTKDLFGLTKRELQILRLTAEGLSNRLIAKRLWVTEQTVKFHLSNTYRKLGVSNRTEASRKAQLSGLLRLNRTED